MAESEEYRRGLNLAGRRAWNDGYTAGLLAGLRRAATKTVPHYTGAAGIEYQAVEALIAHVEATGELPEA